MKERIDIDRFIKEKLKNVDMAPPEAVWENISSRLPKKEPKRRLVPLWYRVAGVAAILVGLFIFSDNFFGNSSQVRLQSPIVNQEGIPWAAEFTFSGFEETMLEASIILQDLIKDPVEKTEKVEVGAPPEDAEETGETLFAGMQDPQEKDFSKPKYSFLDYSRSAVENNEGQQVEEEESKIAEVPVPLDLVEEADDFDEKTIENPAPANRFEIMTTAAAVFFDNMGSRNAMNNQLANRQGGGEVAMSYGIKVAYQISEKFKIRSGISKMDLSYNTQDVAYTARVSSPLASPSSLNNKPEMGTTLAAPATGQGEFSQSLGFIEVPIEVEYALIDKKIGLNIIGGGSTFFANQNMISLNSANLTTQVGEAKNLNDVSFSTNIGIGIDYNISPQIQLNLEPMFKYQINTFSNSSGSNPYYLGVYSGVSFKF